MKAVILTRVSTKEQEDGHSLAAQNTRLIEYAKRKELTVLKTYQIIESSTKGKRKEFMEMINFCKQQKEKIAIVADAVDRVQRGFKESVLLDDLIRKEKIELHFYREGMIIGSGASSSDIMRWDFSVMGAKSYVLQLSENVRRSLDYKVRNGEKAGIAPLGYENFKDANGKNSIRPKEPDATKVKRLFETYALGRMSMRELALLADSLGLKSIYGKKINATSIQYMLDNPFYYGEMRVKGKLIRHVYKPLITKDIWNQCQINRGNAAAKPFRYSSLPFLYRGLITCVNSGKTCPSEIKKKQFAYVVCYRKDGSRMYVPESEVDNQIGYILNRIKLPEGYIEALRETLKSSKAAEIEYRNKEVGRLKSEQTKLQDRLDRLFEMRLDGEINKSTYETKSSELKSRLGEVEDKIKAHSKADDGFNETLIGLHEIANHAGEAFSSGYSLERKRSLLKFVFERLEMDEGRIGYKLNSPFDVIESSVSSSGSNSGGSFELSESKKNQGIQEKVGLKISCCKNSGFEPKKIYKKQEVRNENLTSKQSGCPICSQFEPIDITPFLEKREEIISMKEQVSLVRKLIAA